VRVLAWRAPHRITPDRYRQADGGLNDDQWRTIGSKAAPINAEAVHEV
jgi:hypothetical protein